MENETDLQDQCHKLLEQLKINQVHLRQSLPSDGQSSSHSSMDRNLMIKLPENKPEYARQKLRSIIKPSRHISVSLPQDASDCAISGLENEPEDSRNSSASRALNKNFPTSFSVEGGERVKLKQGVNTTGDLTDDIWARKKERIKGQFDHFVQFIPDEGLDQSRQGSQPVTPVSVRRRRIIDQNVHVDSALSEAELRDLLRNSRRLNFSYSQGDKDEAGMSGNTNNSALPCEKAEEPLSLSYHQTLQDNGNNRQLNNFIRDTTVKPKTILNSTQSFGDHSKSSRGVSFQDASNASGSSSLFRSQAKERRLLGYDWIAALIHNDTGLMEESESFFQDLREFRRCNRDECCNDFYMEGPLSLAATEPPAVEQALTEAKVQPYTVNERLFTVPVTENLLGQPMDPDNTEKKHQEPTEDNPRFVRVSIPRSTLQAPYRARAHRRRSFEEVDSCSLLDHCLMGWNAAGPASLPRASSVSLTDALTGVNPKHTTTMAEAERAASTFHWPLLTDPHPTSLPAWSKQHLHTTLHLPRPDSRSLSSSLVGGTASGTAAGGPDSTRRKTDQLLSSTYSMMYEMQRVQALREEERKRAVGKAAS